MVVGLRLFAGGVAEVGVVLVEVVGGLKPGEKVIVSGYDAYQKMDRIEFDSRNSNS